MKDVPVRGPQEESIPARNGDDGVTNHAARLNRLRAGVLGANDGLLSVAGLVAGVAGATSSIGPILTAGIAGLAAGAVAMALGEFVSVSSQRDAERSLITGERRRLEQDPGAELNQLTAHYRAKGMSETTARTVAVELTAHDPHRAHVDAHFRLDPDNLTNPIHAAISSGLSFTFGASVPIAAIWLAPPAIRIAVTFVAVLLALAVTGGVSARLGGAGPLRAILRIVVGGALAMLVTFGVGRLLGVSGI